jgi:cytochrome c-type biogenesis protein CcmH/NrfG
VEAVAGSAAAADSRAWWSRSWAWIRDHPGDFTVLLLRRLGLTLQGREIAQIESVSFHRQRLWPLQLFWVSWFWILPLALLGIGFILRRWGSFAAPRRDSFALFGFTLVTLVPCLLFFVTARYRLAALPFFCLLAGCGVAGLGEALHSRDTRRLVSLALVLAGAVALTRLGAQASPNAAGWEMAQMAERAYTLGDLDGTIRQQQEAARLLPRRLEVRLNLALYLAERQDAGDLERAEALLRELVQRDPAQPHFLYALGTILVQQQKLDEARRAWEEALRLDPDFTPARESLQLLRGPDPSKRPGSP